MDRSVVLQPAVTNTTTAWILVAVVAFLNQLGSQATSNLITWLLGAVGGTVFAIIGFAVAALVINWVARTLFNADVTFEELVRTLGLAYVWNVIGVIGVLAAFSAALSCLLAPAMIIAVILMVIAWFVAAKEALDLEWGQTIVTVIPGSIALIAIMVIPGVVLGLLGLGAAVVGGALGLYTATRWPLSPYPTYSDSSAWLRLALGNPPGSGRGCSSHPPKLEKEELSCCGI